MKLFIVRHGQSTANARRILQGQRIDEGLSELGQQQAREAAEKVVRLELTLPRIYASPLRRACETAEIIAEHLQAEIVYCPELMEKDFGELSGLAWEADTRENRVTYDYRAHGGENDAAVRRRIESLLRQLKNNDGGEAALAVSHGGIIHMIRHVLGLPRQEESFKNASIHELEI